MGVDHRGCVRLTSRLPTVQADPLTDTRQSTSMFGGRDFRLCANRKMSEDPAALNKTHGLTVDRNSHAELEFRGQTDQRSTMRKKRREMPPKM